MNEPLSCYGDTFTPHPPSPCAEAPVLSGAELPGLRFLCGPAHCPVTLRFGLLTQSDKSWKDDLLWNCWNWSDCLDWRAIPGKSTLWGTCQRGALFGIPGGQSLDMVPGQGQPLWTGVSEAWPKAPVAGAAGLRVQSCQLGFSLRLRLPSSWS